MNHWMQNQQFLTKPQLWNGTEESEGHAGTKRQMDCSKQMVNRQRNLRKSDWMWRKKDKKLSDTQRETEITSAAQQESWWERARNFLVHARTTHTVCLSVCVTVSLYVCLCGHTQASMCVCVSMEIGQLLLEPQLVQLSVEKWGDERKSGGGMGKGRGGEG